MVLARTTAARRAQPQRWTRRWACCTLGRMLKAVVNGKAGLVSCGWRMAREPHGPWLGGRGGPGQGLGEGVAVCGPWQRRQVRAAAARPVRQGRTGAQRSLSAPEKVRITGLIR